VIDSEGMPKKQSRKRRRKSSSSATTPLSKTTCSTLRGEARENTGGTHSKAFKPAHVHYTMAGRAMSSAESESDTEMQQDTEPNMKSLNKKLDWIIGKLNLMDQKFETLKEKVETNANKLKAVEDQVADNIEKLCNLDDKMDDIVPSKDELKKLEERLDDQGNRLRRNNIVMHNVPEGSEGENVYDCTDFVRQFLTDHMKTEDAENWEIERAHCSPTGPPRMGRVRPIHVKFLRYAENGSESA